MKAHEKKQLLLKEFSTDTPKTVNQVIEGIFNRDIMNKQAKKRGWRFYVHLNKLPSPLEKAGLLEHVGENSEGEKIWIKKGIKRW